jgi:UDP-glucuronate decarboxylase
VRTLEAKDRLSVLVTGGAGFLGSHLVDRLMLMGHKVAVLDNMFTGSDLNIKQWMNHPNFSLLSQDVETPVDIEVNWIFHLACPASPPWYQQNPIKTLNTCVIGTINMLELAKKYKARVLFTSTSEVYGDPKEHPQKESYWGHVNCNGPRSCYDEGKRVGEAYMYAYESHDKVDIRVVRIFNTFGPRMNPLDGRVVSNFIVQSLKKEDMTVYGDGSYTRSFQYCHDLIDGLFRVMNSKYTQPVNLGNPEEFTVLHFAEEIRRLTNGESKIIHLPKVTDDPTQRKPDISTAKAQVNWEPRFSVYQGLDETIKFYATLVKEGRA